MKNFIFGLVVITFLFPGAAFALRIDTAKVRVQLSAQDSYTGTITVENPSDKEVSVKVYLEDFLYTFPFDGSKEFYPRGSTKFSLAPWLNYSPQEFTVLPHSEQKVNFVVNGENLVGSRCGVLFFEASLGTAYEEGAAVNILGRLGSLIFVDAYDSGKNGSFSDIQGGIRKLKGTFTNSGTRFLHVKGTFFIMDEEGMVEDRGQISDLYLLSENRGEVEIGLTKSLAPKNYIMVLTFDMEDGDVLVKEIDFSLSAYGEVKVLDVRD